MPSASVRKYEYPSEADPPLCLVGDAPYSMVGEDEYPLAERLVALKKWGTGTHSFLTLYPGVQYFRIPGLAGYIPVSISEGFILIIGQPVCAEAAAKALLGALKDFADSKDSSIGAVPAGETGRALLASCGFRTFYVGREPIFDLTNLPKLSRSIRQAVTRAKRKGLRLVTYHERYRLQMETLCQEWQEKRELPPMGFLFELHPLDLKEHKKYFLVVDKQDRVKSFLACSPIYEKNGWYLEDLIRDSSAPNGCTELMVTETLKVLAMEGYDMATLGLSPLAGLPDKDAEHPVLNWLLHFCYKHLSFIYHFKALEHFKSKFHPNSWEGNYFCNYRKGTRVMLIAHLLASFVPYDFSTAIKHKFKKRNLE